MCFLSHSLTLIFHLLSLIITTISISISSSLPHQGVFPFSANSRARATMDSEGMVKILADKTTDKILGMHM